MVKLTILIFTLLLGGCQTVKPADEVDIGSMMMSAADLRQQEAELTEINRPVPTCGTHDKMRSLLQVQYDEKPAVYGMANDGSILTVFSSPKKTFTITRLVNGIMCIVVVGNGLEIIKEPGKTI